MAVIDKSVDLFFFTNVNHQHALDSVGPSAALKEQRHRKNDIGSLDCFELLEDLALDHGVKDPFEFFLGVRIGENDFTHQITLHSLSTDHVGTEGDGNFRKGFAAGARELTTDLVGVNHRYAQGAKNICRSSFTAGDAACHSNDHCHTGSSFLLVSYHCG